MLGVIGGSRAKPSASSPRHREKMLGALVYSRDKDRGRDVLLRAARARFARRVARANINSNTGALPEPPSGELAPLNPSNARPNMSALSAFMLKDRFQAKFFHFPP